MKEVMGRAIFIAVYIKQGGSLEQAALFVLHDQLSAP
jgi:hypothetical protein